jgi:hypothetical protein
MNNQTFSKLLRPVAAIIITFLVVGLPGPALAGVSDEPVIQFGASPTTIRLGECTTVSWNTANVQAVYYHGLGVSGINQSRIECPRETTTYTLTVVGRDGLQHDYAAQVIVDGHVSDPGQVGYGIAFNTDRTQIQSGECVTISWNVINVQAVYYNGEGVSGDNQTRQECPRQTTNYTLRVAKLDGTEETRTIQIQVAGGSTPRSTLVMNDGQQVDFDRDARVSDREDDFAWQWTGGEQGVFAKSQNHPTLRLAPLRQGGADDLDGLMRDTCQDHLNRNDNQQITLIEQLIVCFRTDDGNYGKFRVKDIRSSNGRLELEWYLWK